MKVSPHTYIIGLPDAQKRYTQKRFARASAVRLLALSVFFGSHNGARIKFDFCSAEVRKCERSRGI